MHTLLQMEYQFGMYRRQSEQVLTTTNEHKYVKRKVTETTAYLRCAGTSSNTDAKLRLSLKRK